MVLALADAQARCGVMANWPILATTPPAGARAVALEARVRYNE